jgi:transcription initiation factor TFIIIB Brf1 subunit/transcription initiation factor TFIIB
MSETILKDQIVCVECGSTDFISEVTRGDVVCRWCGVVNDKIIEGSHFLDRSDGIDSRTGSPESRRGHSTSFRVFDANTDQRDKYRRMYNAENSAYDAISENKARILTILTRLGLSEHARNDLMFELKKIYAAEKRKGNKITNIFLVTAALTIKHMKNRGIPCSINDIVNLFKEHNCKLSSKAVRDYIIETNMNYRTSSAKEFVPKYLAKLKEVETFKERLANVHPEDELSFEKMATTIQRMATKLCDINVNGRKPSVFAVSCIFLATNMVGQRYLGQPLITKEEISRYLRTPSTTLREHCRYVQTHLKMNL